MNSASQGDKALAESNAPLAIQHYTRALSELPRAPAYYIQRSTAYSRLKPADGGPNHEAALQDAEVALVLARERGKRELVLAAQMRRAVSLFQTERFGDAQYVMKLIEEKTSGETGSDDKSKGVQEAMAGSKNKKNGYSAELPIWMIKVRRRLSELGEGDEKAIVSVTEYPSDVRLPTEKELKAQWEALKSGKIAAADKTSAKSAAPAPAPSTVEKKETSDAKEAASPNASAPSAPQKVRHEWYQSQDSVVVTLYAKGVAKDNVQTELKADSISLQIPLPSGSEYDFTLDPLFANIDPSASKVTVMSTKIEVTLRKQAAGQKWKSLEGSADEIKFGERPSFPVTPAAPASQGPSYPSSSRSGPKDWDKLANSLGSNNKSTKKTGGGENADDSDNESIGSDYGGDPTNAFFQKLYADADPDTRRAMMKSYVESNGTSLSTNWSEVGNKKMEPYPSD